MSPESLWHFLSVRLECWSHKVRHLRRDFEYSCGTQLPSIEHINPGKSLAPNNSLIIKNAFGAWRGSMWSEGKLIINVKTMSSGKHLRSCFLSVTFCNLLFGTGTKAWWENLYWQDFVCLVVDGSEECYESPTGSLSQLNKKEEQVYNYISCFITPHTPHAKLKW